MTADLDRKKTQCVAVHSPRGAKTTSIEWGDGHKGVYPHAVLRGYCPCAACQGHTGVIAFIPHAEGPALEIDDIEPVGAYALRIAWFDGHSSGLYSYRYLRSLCQCAECTAGADPDARPPRPPR